MTGVSPISNSQAKAGALEITFNERIDTAASGTVTLEAALTRTPTIVTYKVAPLTYLLGSLFIRNIRYINEETSDTLCNRRRPMPAIRRSGMIRNRRRQCPEIEGAGTAWYNCP